MTGDRQRDDLRFVAGMLAEARDRLATATDIVNVASSALEAMTKGADPEQCSPACAAPVPEHLREHRPGKPKKLAADPELRAFVEARFNRLTFEQIAEAVAANFPPERRVRRSAIHDWWQRVYKRKNPDHPG